VSDLPGQYLPRCGTANITADAPLYVRRSASRRTGGLPRNPRLLNNELGIDPGHRLRNLQQQILRSAPQRSSFTTKRQNLLAPLHRGTTSDSALYAIAPHSPPPNRMSLHMHYTQAETTH